MTDYSKAYEYDENGYFNGVVDCQIDPKATALYRRTIYLMPANATYKEPLPEIVGYKILWNGEAWEYEEEEKEPEPYEPTPEEEIQMEINELKCKLRATDYKVIKCDECVLVSEELPYNMEELHAERQALRDRINELEERLIASEAE